ncbi:hypothetical protein AK812_SmicGene28143 [Symbiodinium microadriaticum]|uniref:Uncharacterized protein n=1 Tax=Symbiodinium microadriaticum TaxID=2951 RepID=A0A1Q9D519_SYMMI|nr:hypothetical protein AK812_SmicGene28143 [Symbiodinium microadriaticum]
MSGTDAERLASLLDDHCEISYSLWEERERLVDQAFGVDESVVSDGGAVRDTANALQEARKVLELEIFALAWSLGAEHDACECSDGNFDVGDALKGLDDREGAANPEEALQTKVVPNYIVARDIHLWDCPIRAELSSLLDVKRALFHATWSLVKKWAEMGYRVCVIPSRSINSIKAPSAKLKTRIVGCGTLAMKGQFTPGATDIKTALLNARLLPRARELAEQVALEASGVPTADELALNEHGMPKMLEDRPEVVVIRPPNFLVQRQYVSAGEAWVVLHAVYGLDQSPRDWWLVRDTQVENPSGWQGTAIVAFRMR